MRNKWTWTTIAGLLIAATAALAAAAPEAPTETQGPAVCTAASTLACPQDRHGGRHGCRCPGGNAEGEPACPGDGS
ncbi:MAG: hypothetical protein QME96_13415, partial [Myxococcota bacterium]|nr:hypothetical protein [Myxococcota bacterium]